jgi:hypothetical protein
MKKDTEKTRVVFLWDQDTEGYQAEVFAFFPDQEYFHYPSTTKVSYSHVGQHSACVVEYAQDCKEATPREYSSLKVELQGLGYNLLVVTLHSVFNRQTA